MNETRRDRASSRMFLRVATRGAGTAARGIMPKVLANYATHVSLLGVWGDDLVCLDMDFSAERSV